MQFHKPHALKHGVGILASFVVLSGCSDTTQSKQEQPNPTVTGGAFGAGASGGASSEGGSGSTSGGAGGIGNTGGGCQGFAPPELDGTGPSVFVGTVKGRMLDELEQAPAAKVFTVCADACFRGEIGSDGSFGLTVNHTYKPSSVYSTPKLIYHGWPDYADVTVHFVPEGISSLPTADVGTVHTIALGSAPRFAYPEPTAGTFDDGQGFSISVEECQLELPPFEEEVVVAHAGVERSPLPTPAGLLDLFFVGPDNSYFRRPAVVRFPNRTGLAPGSTVEIIALGNMGTTSVVEAGKWGTVGSGRVSDDGALVLSDPSVDSGLITLGWIGYRSQE